MNGRLIWKVIVTCVLPCLVATQSPRAVLSTPRFSETDVRLSPSACKSFEVVCNIGTPFTSRMEWVIRTHRLPPAISTNETTRRMIYDSPVSINFTFDLTAYRVLLICNADDQDGKLVWSGYISFQVNKTVENRWDDYKDAVTCDKTDDGVKSTNGSNGVVLLPTNASQQINGSLTSSGSSVYTTGHYTTSHPTTRLPTPSSVVNPTETSTLPSQSDAMPMWIYFVIPPVALILILICVVVIYFKRKAIKKSKRKLEKSSELPGISEHPQRYDSSEISSDSKSDANGIVLTAFVMPSSTADSNPPPSATQTEKDEKIHYADLVFPRTKSGRIGPPKPPRRAPAVQYAEIKHP